MGPRQTGMAERAVDSGRAIRRPRHAGIKVMISTAHSSFALDSTKPDILGREVGGIRTGLFMPSNTYEIFAFGASSIVAAIGAFDPTLTPGTIFSTTESRNLQLSFGRTRFNDVNTGHSAQFVHAYIDINPYWIGVVNSIK